jgi:hypothetical protein
VAAALTSPHSAAAGSTTKQQSDELILTMAATGNGATVVKGTLQGPANKTFTVELFRHPFLRGAESLGALRVVQRHHRRERARLVHLGSQRGRATRIRSDRQGLRP